MPSVDAADTDTDDAAAWLRLEALRWDGPPGRCPRCGVTGRCSFLPARDGARTTTTGTVTARRVWRCAACRQQFTVLTGTLLERTRVRPAVWLRLAGHSGSARGMAREHGLTPEAARGVLARLACVPPDPDAATVLRRLLRLPADEVERLRGLLPTRRPRTGPRLDYH